MRLLYPCKCFPSETLTYRWLHRRSVHGSGYFLHAAMCSNDSCLACFSCCVEHGVDGQTISPETQIPVGDVICQPQLAVALTARIDIGAPLVFSIPQFIATSSASQRRKLAFADFSRFSTAFAVLRYETTRPATHDKA